MEAISRDEIKLTVADLIGLTAQDISDGDDLITLGLDSIRMMTLADRKSVV